MLSQSYNISASWNVDWYWLSESGGGTYPLGDWSDGYQVLPSGTITGGYNLSTFDGSPIAASTASASPISGVFPLKASTSVNQFSVQNFASAYPDGASFEAPIGGHAIYSGSIQTSVNADWLFSPMSHFLNVNISASLSDTYGPTYGNITATLTDMTSSTTLLKLAPLAFSSPIVGDYTFAVNPHDIYEFNIFGWSNTFDDDFTSQSLTASLTSGPNPITSVPEPGVSWLLPLGFLLLLRFRSGSGTCNRLDPVRVECKQARTRNPEF